jgi:predicted alpha/beta superfamily hydrolase
MIRSIGIVLGACIMFAGLVPSAGAAKDRAKPAAEKAASASGLVLVQTSAVDGVESYSFHSAIMKRDYLISVQSPDDKLEDGKRYPAMLLTDGNWALAAAQIAYGGVSGALASSMFIVGIGAPPSVTSDQRVARRIFEFSPPDWDRQDAFGKQVTEICKKFGTPPAECTGGAPAFSRFIASELLPALQAKFPIDQRNLTLGGISAGGFFGLWVAFQPESPFKNYIISSPAMAYGNGEILRLEAAYARAHADFPIGIYMASGSLEMDDPSIEGIGQIVSGQVRLGGLLKTRKYPSLRLFSEIHQGLGHVDTAPASYARGLRLLLAK